LREETRGCHRLESLCQQGLKVKERVSAACSIFSSSAVGIVRKNLHTGTGLPQLLLS
jgi:hypothetical protein